MVVYLFSINCVFAQNPVWSTKYVADTLGLEESWLILPDLIWKFIVPFLAIWMICLGFLKQLGIFEKAPEFIGYVISLCMALATLPSHIFVVFVSFILGLSGVWATILFFCMFIVGATLYAWRWGGGQRSAGAYIKILRTSEEEKYREIEKLRQDILKEKDPKKVSDMKQKIKDLEDQITDIHHKIKSLI